MFDIASFLTAFFGGWLIAWPLCLLRHTIDRQRGLFSESLAICLPIALMYVVAAIGWLMGLRGPYNSLEAAPVVELVFISLPVFVVVRLMERLRSGDQLSIVDMFRATTAIALMLFAITTLSDADNVPLIVFATIVFVCADIATASSKPARNLAMVFSLSFLLAIFLIIGLRLWHWLLLSFSGVAGTIAFASAIILTPLSMRWLAAHVRWLHSLAAAMAVWRFTRSKPAASISIKPPLDLWHFRKDVCFLNHGSFGAVPLLLRDVQQRIRRECADEPMDFLARQLEQRWLDARFQLATWLGTQAENIAFCENATAGMNEIAHWFELSAGDEVLMNDHEYGAVRRIWKRKCEQTAAQLVEATLPMPFDSRARIVEAIMAAVTARTKLVVLSHITSPTAVILPVEELCQRLNERGVATCIDGPHALLQESLKLHRLHCDFYTASCHKWLCAPIGSGFVYAAPKWHPHITTSRLSWGRIQPATPQNWTDELLWTGTRDYSPYLTVPHAIQYFEQFGRQALDDRNHALARYAREELCQLPGAVAVTPEGREWFGWMVGVWLPPGDYATLQKRLWEKHKIEVPIVRFADRTLVRVSCHLYNTTHDIDFLVDALRKEL